MGEKLGKVDPYFSKLADAMVTWIAAWRQLNPSAAEAAGKPTENGDTHHKMANGTKA